MESKLCKTPWVLEYPREEPNENMPPAIKDAEGFYVAEMPGHNPDYLESAKLMTFLVNHAPCFRFLVVELFVNSGFDYETWREDIREHISEEEADRLFAWLEETKT